MAFFNDEKVKESRELNKEGVDLCNEGEYLLAIEKFKESISVYPTILAKRNLAEISIAVGIDVGIYFLVLHEIEKNQDETGRKEPHHLTVIADSYFDSGELLEALPYYVEAIKRYPKDDKILPELKRRLHDCAVAKAKAELKDDA